MEGTISLRISMRLPTRSCCRSCTPVTFPPGRAMLFTNPASTMSPLKTPTMGIVFVKDAKVAEPRVEAVVAPLLVPQFRQSLAQCLDGLCKGLFRIPGDQRNARDASLAQRGDWQRARRRDQGCNKCSNCAASIHPNSFMLMPRPGGRLWNARSSSSRGI